MARWYGWLAGLVLLGAGSCVLDRSGLHPGGSGDGAMGGRSSTGGAGGEAGSGAPATGGMAGAGGSSKKELGALCQTDAECASDACVDGMCCDSACDGVCEACSMALTGDADGTCSFIPAGQDPKQECNDPQEWCDGMGACRKKPTGVGCSGEGECLSGECVDDVCCDAACSGNCQACSAVETGGVDGVCADVTAWTDPNDDCSSPELCDGKGSCSLKPDGEPCSSSSECQTDGCCTVCDQCCNQSEDGQETDIDCGGPDCPGCVSADDCDNDADCLSGVCCTQSCASGWSNECLPAHCGNNQLDFGSETGTDCGGGTCPKCPDGQPCLVDDDCISDDCAGACVSS